MLPRNRADGILGSKVERESLSAMSHSLSQSKLKPEPAVIAMDWMAAPRRPPGPTDGVVRVVPHTLSCPYALVMLAVSRQLCSKAQPGYRRRRHCIPLLVQGVRVNTGAAALTPQQRLLLLVISMDLASCRGC